MRGMREMRRGMPDAGNLYGRKRGFYQGRVVQVMWRMRRGLSKRRHHFERLYLSRPTHVWIHRKSLNEPYEFPALLWGQRRASSVWQKGALIMKKAVHLLISGRVQGVFYRYTAQRVASRLDISGWVKNLPNGKVEAVAVGTPSAVDTFIAWCQEGPPGAHVFDVAVTELPAPQDYEGFSIKY